MHKRLTSESVLIFENFVLKVADFSTNEVSEQTDKVSRAVSNVYWYSVFVCACMCTCVCVYVFVFIMCVCVGTKIVYVYFSQ